MKALFIAALILVSAVPRTNAQHASKSWQNALERAKRNETFGIRLESYKVKDTLRTDDDVRRIIDGWFDDEAIVVTQLDCDTLDIPDLSTMLECLALVTLSGGNSDKIFPEVKENVSKKIETGMIEVALTWDYQGERYFSTAVVSDTQGFVFDNIGTYIIVDRNATKTDCRSPTNRDGGFYRFLHRRGYGINIYGLPAYRYEISHSVYFDKDNIIQSINSKTNNDMAVGWKSEAEFELLADGEIGISDKVTFMIHYRILRGGLYAGGTAEFYQTEWRGEDCRNIETYAPYVSPFDME